LLGNIDAGVIDKNIDSRNAFRPNALIDSATTWAFCNRVGSSVTATSAPASANAKAMDLPSPEPAPVTKAVLPDTSMQGSTRSSEGVDFLGRFMVLSVRYLRIGNLKLQSHPPDVGKEL
jgi:hypothetical protein